MIEYSTGRTAEKHHGRSRGSVAPGHDQRVMFLEVFRQGFGGPAQFQSAGEVLGKVDHAQKLTCGFFAQITKLTTNGIVDGKDSGERDLVGVKEAKSRIEDELSDKDLSWDYEQVTGNVINRIVSRAALADLVVTGRAAHRSEFVGAGIAVLGDLLHRSRTPLFIPGEGGKPCDPTGPALVAWDGSYESANAVRSALGMLACASAVHVVQVEEEKETPFPGTRLLEYLSRHGIHAELTIEYEAELDRNFIPDTLVARAITVMASYLVMGGYNHSRLGQYVFGGVTRSMLSASPIPLLIAH